MRIAQSSKLIGSSRKLRQELEAAEKDLHAITRELDRAREELTTQEEEKIRLETRLRLLEKAVETVNLGVTITDMKGKIIYVNPADARMHGYAVDELIGKEARMFAARSGLSESGRDISEPWVRQRLDATKDGQSFPVRLISDRVTKDDQTMATVTICEDIREQEHVREALSRRDAILKAVGLSAERLLTDPSWEESVEEVLERLGSATGVELIYMSVVKDESPFATGSAIVSWTTPGGAVEERLRLAGLPDRVELFTFWRDRLQAGQTLQGRVSELPGEEREILEAWGVSSFLVVPIFVESKLRGYLSLEDGAGGHDWLSAEIQALKSAARTFGASIQTRQAELALAQSEEKYRDLLDNANDLIQSVSPDGRFQYVNRAWKDTLGYSDAEVQKLKLWDVVRQHPTSERDVVQSILAGDGKERLEAIFETRDGAEISVEGSINARFVDGMPVATRGIFRDITERKLVDRMKQEFISTVSHELRTPLTSIIASLGLLDSGRMSGDPERVHELVAVALRNSNRLLQLINNLLDQQKLADGKMTFKNEVVEVVPVIQEVLDDIRSFADMLNIELRFESEEVGLFVRGDRERLGQVLSNLLSNAIKFSPPGDAVTLGCQAEQGRVIVTISDNGPGIPEDFRDRLFEKFTQFDASATRRSGGSGLGLSIARGLVAGMNGHISLDTGVERGATFHVELPRTDPHASLD